MKAKIRAISMALCLSVLVTSIFVLTQRAEANVEDTERVTFSEPVMIAGTLLEADTYKLAWEGTGPQVQVTFTKGSRTVATASATLVMSESKYDGAIETKTNGDSKVLEKITWKKKALIFEPSS